MKRSERVIARTFSLEELGCVAVDDGDKVEGNLLDLTHSGHR